MIILMAGKAGNLAKKIGIASICAATALSGFAKDYSVVDDVSIPNNEYVVRSDTNVKDDGLESKVRGVKMNKVMHRGKVLYDSGISSEDNYTTSSSDKDNVINSFISYTNFHDMVYYGTNDFTSTEIEMFDRLPDPGDNLMKRDKNGEDFSVHKNLTNVYHIGFINSVDGDAYVGGYANNENSIANDSIYTNWQGYCSGSIYGSVFTNNSSIEAVTIVYDPDGGQFASIDSTGFSYDDNTEVWFERDIEFNGIQGDPSKLGAVTYTNTLILPSIVITPYETRFTTNNTSISWLRDYGYTNNMNAAAMEDPDGDGHLNWQEYQTDKIPTNASSILTVGINSNSDVVIDSSINCEYSVKYCDDLISGSWSNLESEVQGTGNEVVIEDLENIPQRFYRIGAKRK
jgi:hypothetical protein